MVRLREIPRTAAFAWSPGAGTPLLATGTKAGAVDADFSSDTQLELWNLHLGDSVAQELQPAGRVETDSRFHDIAWVETTTGNGNGIIAGALESGSLDLWDAGKLLDGESAFVSRTTKHSGAIKALQFNPVKRELLATAGAKGELFVSDLENVKSPFRLGNTAARADDFECLDWNKKVSHIMVTGSNGGFVTVWDVKMKKESLTLNNHGRKPVGAVAWDPEKSTRLVTAVPLDNEPLILVWDLRNSNAPEKVLRGHEGGVLSLSWCSQDNDLLLSCGKDNKTICWNAQTGDPYGEFPVVTNWTFQTGWNPHNPNILATASFDGKIAVHTLQSTSHDAMPAQEPLLDGEAFFNKAQSQPQTSSFSLSKAPKWLKRPVGASFGFAGKLVTFGLQQGGDAAQPISTVKITAFEIDSEVSAMTASFATAMENNDMASLCQTRAEHTQVDTEKSDWKVLETLTSKNTRKALLSYLGFGELGSDDKNGKLTDRKKSGETSQAERLQKNGTVTNKANRLSAYFEGNSDGDNFLADLASTKGAKTNNPFQIYADGESDTDKNITQALMLGQFDQAMELSLQEGRLSDAFMIAICGGQTSIDKVQKAYFQKQASGPKYLRLLASIVGKNLWDIVYNADLKNWREVMATLCTYASSEDFPELCEALGDRLEEQASNESVRVGLPRNASFCYLAGSKLEKVVSVWIDDLQALEEQQTASNDEASSFAVHARALQQFVEKVTVFREATKYHDKGLKEGQAWKLEPLYQKYVEYADITAAHGHLELAETYLKLLPEKHPLGIIAMARIKEATRRSALREQPLPAKGAGLPPNRPTSTTADPRMRMYNQSSQPYAQQPIAQSHLTHPTNANAGYGIPNHSASAQLPSSRPIVPPPPSFGVPSQGPPRAMNASPSVAPSRLPSTTNWNDTPEDFFKPPTSRRGTPAAQVGAGPTPFQGPALSSAAPNMGAPPLGTVSRGPQPVAPPPKGPAPPPRSLTPQQSYQPLPQPERPPSAAANAYAPSQMPTEPAQQPPVLRGRSPYDAPPAAAPRDLGNRYAPAPAPAGPQPPAPAHGHRPPPPSNPYAPRQSLAGPQLGGPQISGPPSSFNRPPSGPPAGSQVAGPPLHAAGPPLQPQQQQPGPPPPQKSSTPKYPPGDRSHIPDSAKPIYEILNTEMQRVKPLAPAAYKNHVNDAEKRLGLLFDHLNNETMLKPDTIRDMVELAQALKVRDHDKATSIHIDLHTNKTDECAIWMPGVKRLIGMSKAIP